MCMDAQILRPHATHMDVGSYDSKEGIGRVESGTETESNAGAVTVRTQMRGEKTNGVKTRRSD